MHHGLACCVPFLPLILLVGCGTAPVPETPPTAGNADGMVVEVVRLQHADAEEVADLIDGILCRHLDCRRPANDREPEPRPRLAMAHPATNSLVLHCTPQQLPELRYLIAQLDVPGPDASPAPAVVAAGVIVEVVPLQHATTAEFADLLDHLFCNRGGPAPNPRQVMVHPASNSLVIHGTAPQLLELRDRIAQLDVPAEPLAR